MSLRSVWARVSALVAVVLPLAAAPALAQQASIAGAITDESMLAMPGVTVTVTNLETGIQAMAVTDERGEYRVLRLVPGRYSLQAEIPGFATTVIEGIELLVGANANVPITTKLQDRRPEGLRLPDP